MLPVGGAKRQQFHSIPRGFQRETEQFDMSTWSRELYALTYRIIIGKINFYEF